MNRRGAVLRRVDRCQEVLEIQGLREIMLLNAAKLYYQKKKRSQLLIKKLSQSNKLVPKRLLLENALAKSRKEN